MWYSYYDPCIWLEARQKYAGICTKMQNQVEIRNGFQSLQYFSLYQSHKYAQKPVQGHKLHMVIGFCFPHSTKYPWLQGWWIQWLSGWMGGWVTWSSWMWPCSLQENWSRWALQVPSSPNYFMTMLCTPFLPSSATTCAESSTQLAADGNEFPAPPCGLGSKAGAQPSGFPGTTDVRVKGSDPAKATQQTQHLYLQRIICHLIVFCREACPGEGSPVHKQAFDLSEAQRALLVHS